MEYHQITWITTLVLLSVTFMPLPRKWGDNVRIGSLVLATAVLFAQEIMLTIPLKIRIDLIVIIPLFVLSVLTIGLLVLNRFMGVESPQPFLVLKQWRTTYDVLVIPVWLSSVLLMFWIRGSVFGVELLGQFYWIIPGIMIGGVLLKNASFRVGRYLFLVAVPIELLHVSFVAMKSDATSDWLLTVQSISALFYFIGLIVYGSSGAPVRETVPEKPKEQPDQGGV